MVDPPAGFIEFVKGNLGDLERFAARYVVYSCLPVHHSEDILEDALVLTLERWPGDLEYATEDRRRGFVCKAMSYYARNLARREAKWLPYSPDYFREGYYGTLSQTPRRILLSLLRSRRRKSMSSVAVCQSVNRKSSSSQ